VVQQAQVYPAFTLDGIGTMTMCTVVVEQFMPRGNLLSVIWFVSVDSKSALASFGAMPN
jgi:hypothetical protein